MNNLYLTNLSADKNTISRQNIKNNCFVAWKSHKKQAKTEGRLIFVKREPNRVKFLVLQFLPGGKLWSTYS